MRIAKLLGAPLGALVLAATVVGCVPPTRGVTHMRSHGSYFYVAYVEDVDSNRLAYATRIQRCVIQADNSAVCVPETEANAVLTPDAPPATAPASGAMPPPAATTPTPAATVAPPAPAAPSVPAPAPTPPDSAAPAAPSAPVLPTAPAADTSPPAGGTPPTGAPDGTAPPAQN